MDFNNLSVFEIVLIAQASIDVVLITAIAYCITKFRKYSRQTRIMTAESKVVATDPSMIVEWASKREKLKKGSPKWLAYTNRLKQVGYITHDGQLAKPDIDGD